MKEKIKNTKGITLVALIITIIVLLILAVVAITSINNNKIIEYAKNGRDSYAQKKAEEEENLNSFDHYIENNISNSGTGTANERTFYVIGEGTTLGIIKLKSNNKIDWLFYNLDGKENEKFNAMAIYGTDCMSYTVSDGKYYIIRKNEDTNEEERTESSITKVGDYNVLNFIWNLNCWEEMPAVDDDLVGKSYVRNSGNITYTMKKHTVKGVSFMNLYENGKVEGDPNNCIAIVGNNVYEINKGKLITFGTINLDKKSSDYGKITAGENGDIYTPSN